MISTGRRSSVKVSRFGTFPAATHDSSFVWQRGNLPARRSLSTSRCNFVYVSAGRPMIDRRALLWYPKNSNVHTTGFIKM